MHTNVPTLLPLAPLVPLAPFASRHVQEANGFPCPCSQAATWSFSSPSNRIQGALGEQINNGFQFLILFALCGFLALLFPETQDLDTAEGRKIVGGMLVVSDICDTYVFSSYMQALHGTRAEAARLSYDHRVCLNVQYGIACFFFLWGVVYPTIVFFFLENSWTRLRTGLVIDASVFLATIAVLYAHGEERYPPGDAPLAVAIFGRPLCSLLAAAFFNLPMRRRISAWGTVCGLFHVQISLHELDRTELMRILKGADIGVPSAAGNESSADTGSMLRSEVGHHPQPVREPEPTAAASPPACSHHTTKVQGRATIPSSLEVGDAPPLLPLAKASDEGDYLVLSTVVSGSASNSNAPAPSQLDARRRLSALPHALPMTD